EHYILPRSIPFPSQEVLPRRHSSGTAHFKRTTKTSPPQISTSHSINQARTHDYLRMSNTIRELLPYAVLSTVVCILVVEESLMRTLYGLLFVIVIALWYWVFWEGFKWVVFGWMLGREREV